MDDMADRELYRKLAEGAGDAASMAAYVKRALEELQLQGLHLLPQHATDKLRIDTWKVAALFQGSLHDLMLRYVLPRLHLHLALDLLHPLDHGLLDCD